MLVNALLLVSFHRRRSIT